MPNDDYTTPPEIFDPLNKVFKFKYDIAAADDNHLCAKYVIKEANALTVRWPTAGNIWCNPPYSKEGGPLIEWTKKAAKEASEGSTTVMLLPADTSTKWFHEYALTATAMKFTKRRVRFLLNGIRQGSPKFGSLIVVFSISQGCQDQLDEVDI